MSTFMRPAQRPLAGLFIAIVCSELLLALSFVGLWGDANSALFRVDVIDATLSQPIWGTALASRLAAFAGALVLVHFLLAVAAWSTAQLARQAWPASGNSLRVWSLFWLVAFVLWILTANAAYFPYSSLGRPYADAVRASLLGVSVYAAVTAALVAGVAATALRAARVAWPAVRRRATWATGTSVALAGTLAFASFGVSSVSKPAPDANRPHVIVIGLDSFRPDTLDAHGPALAPSIAEFLTESTLFTDVLTPLARTFPAWVSIVSGKHPHSTGAVINLLTRDLIHEGDTLPRLLAVNGYHTVYATDEVRFSNLDQSYGFEDMIAPPMGAADFILGFFGDTPLANLLVNTKAGEILFPYAYANRAAAVTYDPDTFIERLGDHLAFDEPTFLAVHLTLVHWPYTWANAPPELDGSDDEVTAEKYRYTVERLDRQFADLVAMLRERRVLDNAVVVVLSDHGESLGEPASIAGDAHAERHVQRLYSSVGHGTSVFADAQYRVLLAMRSFGTEKLPTVRGAELAVPASLEDIAPTLADAFDLEPQQPFDGISWLPVLLGAPRTLHEDRVRFTETEFVPPGFASGVMLSTSVLRGAAAYYRVDAATDRVLIRPERLQEILETRQYAALRDGAMLATVPSDDKRAQHLVYLAERGAAPLWFDAAPTAGAGVPYELWSALQARFAPVRERPVAPPQGGAERTP